MFLSGDGTKLGAVLTKILPRIWRVSGHIGIFKGSVLHAQTENNMDKTIEDDVEDGTYRDDIHRARLVPSR